MTYFRGSFVRLQKHSIFSFYYIWREAEKNIFFLLFSGEGGSFEIQIIFFFFFSPEEEKENIFFFLFSGGEGSFEIHQIFFFFSLPLEGEEENIFFSTRGKKKKKNIFSISKYHPLKRIIRRKYFLFLLGNKEEE